MKLKALSSGLERDKVSPGRRVLGNRKTGWCRGGQGKVGWSSLNERHTERERGMKQGFGARGCGGRR